MKKVEAHAATMVSEILATRRARNAPYMLLSPTPLYHQERLVPLPLTGKVHLLKHLWLILPLVHWLGGLCHLWARRFVATLLRDTVFNSEACQLATSDLQTPMTQTARPPPSPVVNGITAEHSAPAVPNTTRPQAPSKAKGLQLGATKQPLNKTAASSLAAELEKEAAAEISGSDAWANEGDLIDVNADAGDWSESLCLLFRLSPLTHQAAQLADFQSGPLPLELEDTWGDSLDQEINEPASVIITAAPLVLAPAARTFTPSPRVSSSPAQLAKLQNPVIPQQKSSPAVHAPPNPAPSRSVALASPDDWDEDFSESIPPSPAAAPSSVTGSGAGMTKEERAAEMARRREERKQVRRSKLQHFNAAFNSLSNKRSASLH